MPQIKFSTLLLQTRLLLWKNYKLKSRRWKEVLLMIGFAVFSMMLIGVFRADVESQTYPAYEPDPKLFFNYLQTNNGKVAIINKLKQTQENNDKIQLLHNSLQQWFIDYKNNLNVTRDITSDKQLDRLVQAQINGSRSLPIMGMIGGNDDDVKVAIDINKWTDETFDYTIRLPSNEVPQSSADLVKSDKEKSTEAITQQLGIGSTYSSKFIPLQIWMDQFFLLYTKQETAKYNAYVDMTQLLRIRLKFQEFWTKEHEDDPFMDSMGSLLPFYIVSCFLLPFSYMIKDVVEEKNAKIKEGMRTMGLHILSFWISWFITYLGLVSIIASIVVFIQWKTTMFIHTSFALLYILYLLYGLSMITFASAITTFFDSPKTASTVSGFAYFLLQMPAYAVKSRLDVIGIPTKMLFSFSSPTGMFLALLSIIQLEQSGHGYTLDTMFDDNIAPGIQNGYCIGYSLIMLAIDVVIYGTLTWILDQWLASEYGQKLTMKQIFAQLNCCMFWKSAIKKNRSFEYSPLAMDQQRELNSHTYGKSSSPDSDLLDENDDVSLGQDDIPMNLEESHSNRLSQRTTKKKVSIQIMQLSKTFDGNGANGKSVRAVDKLSMNIYEGECCALLGHNGAGKTTSINMLTGMIASTSGTASINGYSINHEMDDIRQFLGVCPQHSLLWPMLTVYEHLYLFAILKNMDRSMIEAEIELLLNDVGLFNKKSSYSSTLSGGQKRKLSLALAFIGDPGVIFLDEPTSGMDPAARRKTWDLVEKYKENRCIVLTTHDMTEADAIADRIAIMSHGRLRIYGSALYLKSVCAVGYNLIFKLDCKYCNGDDIKAQIDVIGHAVQKFIPNSQLFDKPSLYKLIDQHGNKIDAMPSIEVIYKTAIQDSTKFPQLFDYIDMKLDELRILHYAVSITTLEEVFLKIAGDDDIYSKPKVEELHTGTNGIDTPVMSTFDYKEIAKKHSLGDPVIEDTLAASPSKMEELNIDQETIDRLCKFYRPSISTCELRICTLPFPQYTFLCFILNAEQ